jgi:predicted transcriptional regulator
MAITLRLPDNLEQRVADLASKFDSTLYAFMLEAIREKIETEETKLALLDEAETRLARMKASSAGTTVADAFAYLDRRSTGTNPPKPPTRKNP